MFGSKAERAQIEEWRGRSIEIPDAGLVSWKVMWEALRVTDEHQRDWMGKTGLDYVHIPSKSNPIGVYQGLRHGRPVHVRSGPGGGARQNPRSAVWVGVMMPTFTATADGGRVQLGEAIPPIESLLDALATAPKVWSRMTMYGGAAGLLVSRQLTRSFTQAWMYDLWLAERVATVCAGALLPEPGREYWPLPFGVESGQWKPNG